MANKYAHPETALILSINPPQDSLGGNAKTSLLVAACDAAEHVDETLQSLQFGLRAMCVRTQVRLQRSLICMSCDGKAQYSWLWMPHICYLDALLIQTQEKHILSILPCLPSGCG
jgi:hypothetical protein